MILNSESIPVEVDGLQIDSQRLWSAKAIRKDGGLFGLDHLTQGGATLVREDGTKQDGVHVIPTTDRRVADLRGDRWPE